jgi:hypothetical protein
VNYDPKRQTVKGLEYARLTSGACQIVLLRVDTMNAFASIIFRVCHCFLLKITSHLVKYTYIVPCISQRLEMHPPWYSIYIAVGLKPRIHVFAIQ